MNTTPTIIGLYGDAHAIAKDPGFLDAAQAEIGLNRIIFGGPFKLSPETLARNPAHKGQSHGHGLGLTDDDTPLRRAIDEAHRRGIQVWHIISTYWAGAEDAPEQMARDLRGRRMDEYPRLPYADEQWSYTFCPTNEQTNAWFEAAQVELATRYEFDGCALTHHRFCHAAFYPELLACGCPSLRRGGRATGLRLRPHESGCAAHRRCVAACIGGEAASRRVTRAGAVGFSALAGRRRRRAGRLVQLPRRLHDAQPATIPRRGARRPAGFRFRQRHALPVAGAAGRPSLPRFRGHVRPHSAIAPARGHPLPGRAGRVRDRADPLGGWAERSRGAATGISVVWL